MRSVPSGRVLGEGLRDADRSRSRCRALLRARRQYGRPDGPGPRLPRRPYGVEPGGTPAVPEPHGPAVRPSRLRPQHARSEGPARGYGCSGPGGAARVSGPPARSRDRPLLRGTGRPPPGRRTTGARPQPLHPRGPAVRPAGRPDIDRGGGARVPRRDRTDPRSRPTRRTGGRREGRGRGFLARPRSVGPASPLRADRILGPHGPLGGGVLGPRLVPSRTGRTRRTSPSGVAHGRRQESELPSRDPHRPGARALERERGRPAGGRTCPPRDPSGGVCRGAPLVPPRTECALPLNGRSGAPAAVGGGFVPTSDGRTRDR